MKWAGQSLYPHAICVLATHLWCSKPSTPSTPTLLALSWDQHSGPALRERVRPCLWGAPAPPPGSAHYSLSVQEAPAEKRPAPWEQCTGPCL